MKSLLNYIVNVAVICMSYDLMIKNQDLKYIALFVFMVAFVYSINKDEIA